MDACKIVVIGAGFAGLRTALELEKRYARLKACEITLVDRRAEHVYTPLLYEVSSGELTEPSEACAGELRSGVCVPLESYANIVRRKHVRFLRGEMVSVDAEERTVTLSSGQKLPFDTLVVAVGSEVATYGIRGVGEHAYAMKTSRDAFRIRGELYRFLRAYEAGKEKRLSIVACGGGATGVEFIAETGHFFARLMREGSVRREDVSLTLVEAGADILMMMPPGVRAKARRRLAELGVTVLTETKLKEVKRGAIALEAKDGTVHELASDVTVWTAGVKPLEALRRCGLPVDDRGYVKIDPSFAVQGFKNIYALGDCTSFVHPKTGVRVPALAQSAVREAAIVAENVVRALERKLPMTWSPPEKWVTVVPMGGRFAIANFGWSHLSGWPGYAVRKAADLAYFLTILPPREAWKLYHVGATVYAKND